MRNTVSYVDDSTLPIAAFRERPAQWTNNVLGALCFSANLDDPQTETDIPCLHVPMRRLDAEQPICEVWHGRDELTRGRSGAIHYRHDGDVLFGVVILPETLF